MDPQLGPHSFSLDLFLVRLDFDFKRRASYKVQTSFSNYPATDCPTEVPTDLIEGGTPRIIYESMY